MTPRENFFAMIHGEGAERLPFHINLTPPVADILEKQTGTRDPVEGLGSDFGIVRAKFGPSAEVWEQAYASLGIKVPEHCEISGMGITNAFPENTGNAYHFSQIVHTLADIDKVSDLEKLPWPKADDLNHYAGIREEIKSITDRGLVSVLSRQCTIFEHTWYLRGMDNLMFDLMEENEVGLWILDYMAERSIAQVSAYAQAGVDAIWLGDDIGMQQGMMMSPNFWRQHLKPRLAKVIDAARAHATGELFLIYHSDGNVEAVIDDLFEMGIDILNPVQPECMNIRNVFQKYGSKGAFFGMIGTQSTMPFGTPEDCRQAVRELVEEARKGYRIICAPTHVIEPDVPWENVMAVVNEPKSLAQGEV